MAKWTQKEIFFLQENYPKYGINYCAIQLNKSINAINGQIYYLDLYIPKYKMWTSEEENFIVKNVAILGLKECAQKLGCSYKQLKSKSSHLGISVKKINHQKECKVCQNLKPLNFFTKGRYCLDCYPKIRKEKHAEYYIKNKLVIKQKTKAYTKKQLKENPKFKLIATLRKRIVDTIKRESKTKSTKELLGCSVGECKKYPESKFQDGMTWENHGLFGWHIDHIKPCSSFDLSDPRTTKTLFSLY